MRTIQQDAAVVRELKLRVEKAKIDYDNANLDFKRAQQALFDRMEAEDTQSIKAGNVLYVRSETIYGQVQDEDEFLRWAEENAPELFGPKPRKKLVNELVRERINAGDPLPPGVGFYADQYVSQRANG